jgi:twitching motility protein PilT
LIIEGGDLDYNFDEQIKRTLDEAISKKASDVLFSASSLPYIRIDGNLIGVQNTSVLNSQDINQILSTIDHNYVNLLESQKEIDFSFSYSSVRLRANAYHQKGQPAIALRLIPDRILSYQELGAPPIIARFPKAKRGLVVIAGPTGHGKSTTLATLIEDINQNQASHIITIEDPIEYIFTPKRSVISQREVGFDTNSFATALRSAVRQDPNVILLGEIRDFETVDTALMLAETGHLVFTTLHTNSAAESADRIINLYPAYLQPAVRQQLSNVLLGIVSQRLIPKIGGGRALASEILVMTPAVRGMIREGKTHQIDNVIATSASDGMMSLDKVLAEMISNGEISLDDGLMWANDPKTVKTLLY